MSPAVLVRDLRVSRGGTEVVQGVGFALEAGSVVGLLGPSGCGKTTLMRTLVGVQLGVSGSVEVLGQAAGSRGLRSRVGYVTQAPATYSDLTATENMRYFAAVLGADPSRVPVVLEQVGLTDSADRPVRELSGGQGARVSLGTALLGEPDVLVLDEPTVGLDPVLRRDLWLLFRAFADTGATVLVSSHVMDEAVRCDRLLLMRRGRLVADDSPEGLLRSTGTKDVEHAFLAIAEAAA